jgi:hypothetical protein
MGMTAVNVQGSTQIRRTAITESFHHACWLHHVRKARHPHWRHEALKSSPSLRLTDSPHGASDTLLHPVRPRPVRPIGYMCHRPFTWLTPLIQQAMSGLPDAPNAAKKPCLPHSRTSRVRVNPQKNEPSPPFPDTQTALKTLPPTFAYFASSREPPRAGLTPLPRSRSGIALFRRAATAGIAPCPRPLSRVMVSPYARRDESRPTPPITCHAPKVADMLAAS